MTRTIQTENQAHRIMQAVGVLIEALEEANCDARAFAAADLDNISRSTLERTHISNQITQMIRKLP